MRADHQPQTGQSSGPPEYKEELKLEKQTFESRNLHEVVDGAKEVPGPHPVETAEGD